MQYLCDGNWKIINKEGSLVLDLEDYNDFYFDFNVVHYGMGESFTIYTPAGALIVGRVDTNGQEAQDLLKKYWNMKEVVFKEITASSTLPAANSVTYFPENVADGDVHTAWVEGVLGNGENEWLMFSTDQPIKLSSLLIKNGYTKNRDLYLKNNRIKTMKLEFSDGTTQTLNIPDDYYELFYYTLPEEVYTSYVKCTIESVYKGTKYQDTCLSEMKFFTLD